MPTNFQKYKMAADAYNEEQRSYFNLLVDGRQYSESQKSYSLEMIETSGIRATARILQLPRRTLQRWCRQRKVEVDRCPDWVYEWAESRRNRWERWNHRTSWQKTVGKMSPLK